MITPVNKRVHSERDGFGHAETLHRENEGQPNVRQNAMRCIVAYVCCTRYWLFV